MHGIPVTIVGAIASKGRVLGQSFDGMVLMPITTFESMYGRRQNDDDLGEDAHEPTEIDAGDAARARRRCASRTICAPVRPTTSPSRRPSALVDFWKQLTQVLFTVIPAMVAIGIVVGGIVS